jgi:hypothetical protein
LKSATVVGKRCTDGKTKIHCVKTAIKIAIKEKRLQDILDQTTI